MAITTIDDKHLSNIATAIRQKSGVEDTFKPSEMASAIKNISGANPILQEVVVQPSINEQIITPSADYDGLSQVKIGAVTSSIDSDIKPENIKKGISILGVQGTLEQGAEVVKKYKPKHISFYNNTVEDLTEETQMLDTSLVTTMNQMFGSSLPKVLKKIDVSEWDTSNVTDMSYMFANNTSLIELGQIGNFNTSKVTNMYYMFRACSQLTSLDLSKWDTPVVTNTSYMFQNCAGLQYLDVSNFSNGNLTNAEYMFNGCSALKELRLDNFNTSKITKMSNMFATCSSLKILDLSNFDTSNTTSMSSMFIQCSSLEKLDIRNFTFGKVQYTNSMFSYVPANCLIIVKSDTEKTKVLSIRSDLTNVKTLAEYQAEGGV